MNLASAFAESTARNENKTAIFWGDSEISYGRLRRQTNWMAATLRSEFVVKKGDRVGVWLKNCPEFVPALFGVLQAGAVVVPINNFLKPNEVSYILTDGGIDVLIVDATSSEAVAKLRETHPSLQTLLVERIEEIDLSEPLPALAESDLAVIIYTSGTTGHPKGAMLSHGNILANVESCRKVLSAVGEDRFLLALPMFHSFMLTVCVFLPLLIGGSFVLARALHPPKVIVAEMIQRRTTLVPAVPQFFRALTHGGVPVNFPARLCISGGAPLPAEILKEFTEKFPIPLLEGYGLSEASPVCSFNPVRCPRKAGSIGVPIIDVEMSVQDDRGHILGPHQTGEVCIRGSNVMLGYWNQPAETATVMRDGWLLTGDIGHRDSDGYFYITDRKKDMLLVNGINVYPREIEEILYQFPGIKEAAVIGARDARKGEQPVAFVSLQENTSVDPRLVLEFLRERLADYKVPRRLKILPALPRNATGKILKTELRKTTQTLDLDA
jgi:long-chain acyl-CoA synthetase